MSGLSDPRHDWLEKLAESDDALAEKAKGSLQAIFEADMEWRVAIAKISRHMDKRHKEIMVQIEKQKQKILRLQRQP